MIRLFAALLVLAISNTVARAVDRDALVGIYAVDFSGGTQPGNVVLASLTKDNKFLTLGMSGTYKLDGSSLTISLPDEPAPQGKVSETEDGFLLKASIEEHQLVHKYTKLTAVTNTATQVRGRWTVVHDSYQTAPTQPPTVVEIDKNMPIMFSKDAMIPGKKTNGQSYKPQKYRTKIHKGECQIWFEDSKGNKSETFLAYTGGPYLCLIQKNSTGKITTAKVHLKKGSFNK